MNAAAIDAHHHFWWNARHTYSWPPPVGERFARDFTPDDLRSELERCGITGTVLVQVLHELGETEEFLDICEKFEFVRGVVGWLPLGDPEASGHALERLRRRGKFVGVRHLISNEGIRAGFCRRASSNPCSFWPAQRCRSTPFRSTPRSFNPYSNSPSACRR